MAGTEQFLSLEQFPIPTPILGLGENFFLQHERKAVDFNTFINSNYASSSKRAVNPGLTQTGNLWANDTLKVTLSYAKNQDYSHFLTHTPMIFLEVLNNKNYRNNKIRNLPMWAHPVNNLGPLNRSNSNYGGGDVSSGTTEWNFVALNDFKDQTIELDYKQFQRSGQTLPQRLVDYVGDNGNNLRYQRQRLTPTNATGFALTTFQQPIRFRFGYIGDDLRTVHLGEPSEVLYLSPKWGEFTIDGDYYVYDYQVKRKP